MNNNFLIIPQLGRIEESLELAERYGLGFEFNDFFLPDTLDNEEKTDSIIAAYHAHRLPDILTMHGDFLDVTVFSDDSKIREISALRVRQSLDMARKIGARGCVFHTNHNPLIHLELYRRRWLERNIDFWSEILGEYPDINIYIENMFDSSPDMLCALSERLCDYKNYGVCLDYAHAAVFGGGTREWTERISPYVKHLHINDNDLKSDLHLAVGDGLMDWERFKEDYNTLFTNCTVLVEVAGIEKQIKSVDFLRKIGIVD